MGGGAREVGDVWTYDYPPPALPGPSPTTTAPALPLDARGLAVFADGPHTTPLITTGSPTSAARPTPAPTVSGLAPALSPAPAPAPQFYVVGATGATGATQLVGGPVGRRVAASTRPALPPSVALTFDDGPSPLYTPEVLAVLRRYRVPATFFLVGYHALQYPDLVRAEARAGMAVGDHSFDHPLYPPFAALTAEQITTEIARGRDALGGLTPPVRLFRPPGGSYSPYVVAAARRLGLRVVLWSVDPADWLPGASAARIVARVLGAVRPGSIVILHDGGGNRAATVAALPAIVEGIRARGLRLVALA